MPLFSNDALAQKWLVPLHGGDSRARISSDDVDAVVIVFAWSGGSVTAQKNWTEALGAAFCKKTGKNRLLVLGVELPGRRLRFGEPVVETFAAYRDTATKVLLGAKLDDGTPLLEAAPYFLAGYSLGSLAAHQVSQNLERSAAAASPAGYIMIACTNPKVYYDGIRSAPKKSEYSIDDVADLLRRQGGTPEELLNDRDMLQYFLPPIIGDYKICESYDMSNGRWDYGDFNAEYKLSCPVFIAGGDSDEFVPVETLEAWKQATMAVSAGPHLFPGGHFFVNESFEALATKVLDFILSSSAL